MEWKLVEIVAQWLNGDDVWQVLSIAVILVSVLSIIASTAVVWIFKAFKEVRDNLRDLKNQPPKDYKPQVFRDMDISMLLRDIKHNLMADRVCVYQYHNGERSIANNPFLKFSCTHENLRQTAESVQQHMLEMPSSIFNSWNTQIFDGHIVQCPLISDMKEVSDMRTAYKILSNNGVTSIYLFPLVDPIGHTFGFGTVEYCCEKVEMQGNWLEWTRDQYRSVGALLASSVIAD